MLHVTVSLLPGGRAVQRRVIGGLVVGQVGRNQDGYAYGAARWHDWRPDVMDVVGLTSFPRHEEGLWDLLGGILLARPGDHDLTPAIETALRRHLGDLLGSATSAAGNTGGLLGGHDDA